MASPSFSNAGGSLNVSGAFSAEVGSFDNTRGKLQAGSLNIATTGDLVNQDGTLTSDTDAALSVGGHLLNAGGTVHSAGALTAQVAGAALNTAGGSIGAATDLSIRAGSLTNAGAMRGGNDATLAIAGALVNDGAITAGRHGAITAASPQGGSTSMFGAGRVGDANGGAGCGAGAVGAVVGHLAGQAFNPGGDLNHAGQTADIGRLVGGIAGAIVGGDGQSANIAANAGGNAVENNYLTSAQWRSYADEAAQCRAKPSGCSAAEERTIRDRYQQISNSQNVALASCDRAGNCAQLQGEVKAGTQTMLELAGQGQLPIGGAAGNDLGQYAGQNLANDPAYRASASNSLEVIDHCNRYPGECTQQAVRAAGMVVAPLLMPAGVPLTATGIAIGGTIGAAANVGGQLAANGGSLSQVNPVDATVGGITGALTYGATFWPSLFVNTGGAVVSSGINSVTQDGASSVTSAGSIAGAATGTALGYPMGAAVQGGLNSVLNPWYRSAWRDMGLTIQQWVRPSVLPGAGGAAFGSIGQEAGNALANGQRSKVKGQRSPVL